MQTLRSLVKRGTPASSPLGTRDEPRPNNTRPSEDASATLATRCNTASMDDGSSDGPGPASADNASTPPLTLESHASDAATRDDPPPRRWGFLARLAEGVVALLGAVASPFVYTGQCLAACFYYDDDGRYSLLGPIYHMLRCFTRIRRKEVVPHASPSSPAPDYKEKSTRIGRIASGAQPGQSSRRSLSVASTSTVVTSDSESERSCARDGNIDSSARYTRSKSNVSSGGDEIAPAKRSIRITLQHNEQALRQRKAAKKGTSSLNSSALPEVGASLKSPTSSANVPYKQLTKFPRAPQPPRPLVPRRQPSYSASGTSVVGPHQKTLILDLDETLIHSLVNGGRFQTGHMVEVKLQAAVGAGGQLLGPQVPLLYYVHKRPYCDDFLKKVSKWYNLVVFTASVQEYADPVIDWLEVERKYFVGRYYRQHCTLRNGAYIKDLAQIEPDLSKVMILDNSPLSYVFHPDNAIPIEGWISDPTDNDLLHLIPLLEGMQYATDVRALLALRLGMPATA